MKPAARLWKWFQKNARDLPWRKISSGGKRDPYHVWLAEIMLQQTQVKTVIPYYEKFLRHYPTLKNLATAAPDRVLSDWAGLGYYSRARNLHRCAQTVANELCGRWPRNATELQKLPGLGAYTAAAMAALAFGENILAIDGNVARVLSRYGAVKTPVAKARDELITVGQELLYAPANGGSAEALIELGALVCTPKNPKCNECPLQQNCKAFATGTVEKYPIKTAIRPPQIREAQALLITNSDGEILTITRNENGLFGGMMALPTTALQPAEKDHPLYQKYHTRAHEIGKITHVLTHIKFEIEILHLRLNKTESQKIKNAAWIKPGAAKAMPKLFQKMIRLP